MPDRPMNVVVVFPDGHRGHDLGHVGNRQVMTPNLDRLARESVCFQHAYATSTVCTPSRGSLLTGLHAAHHMAMANELPVRTDVPSIGTELRDHGYATGYIGKWHLDGVPRDRFTPPGPRRLGFDSLWEVWNCQGDTYGARYYGNDPQARRYEQYAPFAQAASAIQFMETHRSDPFALFVSWTPPNANDSGVPTDYRRLYDPGSLSLRPNVFGAEIEPTLGHAPADNRDREAEIRANLACHYAFISSLDEALGRILKAMDRLQLAEQTIVVYTSDHGRPVWSHGYNRSELPYEESSRVPLIVRAPGRLGAGVSSTVLIGLVDLVPTLLDLMGIAAPESMNGKSVVPALRGQANPVSSVLMSLVVPFDGVDGLDRAWRAVRGRRYTYAQWEDRTDWFLYDNEADPYQLHNLIEDPIARSLRVKMRDEMKRQLDANQDAFLPWREQLLTSGLAPDWNVRDRLYFGARQQIELP